MLQQSSRSRNFFRKFVVGNGKQSNTVKDAYLTRFFHADLELRNISKELDSFDGKKDPNRCNLLVNQLRTAQDKVISIIFELMNECRCQRASRDYRMKFPDEILLSEGSESLNGQIWFGAECLSAGSNILNHTKESALLRPMAKKLTSYLDLLREDLRDLVVGGGNASWITPPLLKLMGDFDKVFAAFEYEYVKTMLPIRTVSEIEKLQEVSVLFSETLIDCLKRGLLKQEEIDEFQPIVMIAIPRLAIVRGLLYSGENPIYSKHKSRMCSLFQPFHGPLHSIRKLLRNLKPYQLLTLEKMLADDQAASLQDQVKEYYALCSAKAEQKTVSENYNQNLQQGNNYSRILVDNLQYPVGKSSQDGEETNIDPTLLEQSQTPTSSIKIAQPSSSKEAPQIVTPSQSISDNPFDTELPNSETKEESPCAPCNSYREEDPQLQKLITEFDSQLTGSMSSDQNESERPDLSELISTYSPNKSKLEKETVISQIEAEEAAMVEELFVKQAQQLLHRMFVAIAGVADQLQSNFASDLRFILRNIFVTESDDESIEDEENNEEDDEDSSGSPIEEGIEAQEIVNLIDLDSSSPCINQTSSIVIDGASSIQPNAGDLNLQAQQASRVICDCLDPSCISEDNRNAELERLFADPSYTHQVMNHSVSCQCRLCTFTYSNHQQAISHSIHAPSSRGSSRRRSRVDSVDAGHHRSRGHGSSGSRRVVQPQLAPVWVPDQLVVACSRCNVGFTLFRRRHHCRSCGQIFCADCSRYSRTLNIWGYTGPVRVCESCFNRP